MKQTSFLKTMGVVLGLGLAQSSWSATAQSSLPNYQASSGVSGNLSSIGSDTLANLMTFWAEDFKRVYPNVNIQIQAAGSSTAPPALTEGTANLGPMSRQLKDTELEAFENRGCGAEQRGIREPGIREQSWDALSIAFLERPLDGFHFLDVASFLPIVSVVRESHVAAQCAAVDGRRCFDVVRNAGRNHVANEEIVRIARASGERLE